MGSLCRSLLSLILIISMISNVLASGGPPVSHINMKASPVTLDYGTIVGMTSGDSVKLWLGVPYAAPPVGTLRFKPPAAPQNLGSNFQAISYGNWCPQDSTVSVINVPTGTQSEDCLTLNIFAPASANSSSNLPVLVFIHGGSYDSGSGALSTYNGTNMIKNSPIPVVIVTFNYRLGVLGYLAGQELLDEGSTNAGMLDQVAVFQWVTKYIGAFGGNSSSITAFGESAGAESIGAHLIAYGGNQTLFTRGILESGSTLSGPLPNANSTESQTTFNAVAGYVNCGSVNGSAKLSCMRDVAWQSMYNAQTKFQATINSVQRIGIFTPVVDGHYILTKPTVAVTQNLISKTPIIIGTNTNEGTIFVPGLVDSAQALYNASFALKSFVSGFAANMPAGSTDQLLALYPLSSYNNSAVLASAEIFQDFAFICPMLNLSKALTGMGVPVYRYRFNQLLAQAISIWARDGVFHSSELPFVFANGVASAEVRLSQTIIGFWTRFAATGNPNGENDTTTWPVYASGGPAIVLQSSTLPGLSIESDPNKDTQCTFWQSSATQGLIAH